MYRTDRSMARNPSRSYSGRPYSVASRQMTVSPAWSIACRISRPPRPWRPCRLATSIFPMEASPGPYRISATAPARPPSGSSTPYISPSS